MTGLETAALAAAAFVYSLLLGLMARWALRS